MVETRRKDPRSLCTSCFSFLECKQNDCCLHSCVHFADKSFEKASPCKCSIAAPAPIRGTIQQDSCPHFRSTASLPELLDFQFVNKERIVVSRTGIPVRSVFGPLVAPSRQRSKPVDARYSYGSDEAGWMDYTLESDDRCNWMKFVREADLDNQNLAAFQYDFKIIFAVIREIKPGDELRVRYADNYGVAMSSSIVSSYSLPPLEHSEPEPNPTTADVDVDMDIDEEIEAMRQEVEAARNVGEKPGSRISDKKKRIRKSRSRKSGASNFEYICLYCKDGFKNAQEFVQHHREFHRKDDVYQCPHCDKRNPCYHRISEHVKTKHGPQMACETCGYSVSVSMPKTMQRHKIVCASKPHSPQKCNQCDASFRLKRQLKDHKIEQHGAAPPPPRSEERPFRCKICETRCTTEAALTLHEQFKHAKEAATNPSIKQFDLSCIFCGVKLVDLPTLRKHHLTHGIGGRFPCSKCDKTYPSVTTCREHMRSVHVPKSVICEICGKSCKNTSAMRYHMLMHTEADQQCPHCEKIFKRPWVLRNHIKNFHPGEEAVVSIKSPPMKELLRKQKSSIDTYEESFYKCRDCQLGFPLRMTLIAHLETKHPGVRMTTIPELNLPIRKIQGYRCKICGKYFLTEAMATDHLDKKHSDAEITKLTEDANVSGDDAWEACFKTYKTDAHFCEMCETPFQRAKNLLDHARTNHPDYYSVLMPDQESDSDSD